MDFATEAKSELRQEAKIGPVICFIEEAITTVVSPLHDVDGKTRHYEARHSWHKGKNGASGQSVDR